MKASKTEDRFSTDFQQPKTGLPKNRWLPQRRLLFFIFI